MRQACRRQEFRVAAGFFIIVQLYDSLRSYAASFGCFSPLMQVLKGVSFRVHRGEKIGIVGRTGEAQIPIILPRRI
jgi:ABC-type multidrug transport system fused ATPase/permease subunit